MQSESLKAFLTLLITTVNDSVEQLKDGFQFTDLFVLFPKLSQIPAQVDNFPNVIADLKALNDAARTEIVQLVHDTVDANERTKTIIGRAVDVAISGYLLIDEISTKDTTGETAQA